MGIIIFNPQIASADFWGGDLVYLSQILDRTISQYKKIKELTRYSGGTLDELKEINSGLKQALALKETLNHQIRPGALSDLDNVVDLVRTIEHLYGKIPKTSQAKTQKMNDTLVAEGIHLHNEAFRYAENIDPMAENLKQYGQKADMKHAIRASVQGQGMIIHVLNQILRTNAAILKIQSQNLAMKNQRAKMESYHFRKQYKSLGKAFGEIKKDYDLTSFR